ncbi:hypothetical protein GW17_00043593 [Ensete ventricosum]|nr:hypothetical protein GW17_00043593 [Ensete ventricosum]
MRAKASPEGTTACSAGRQGGPTAGRLQWACGQPCRQLGRRLPMGKGSRRLRRGNSDDDGAEGARGVRASFLEKDDPTPMNSKNFEDCPFI